MGVDVKEARESGHKLCETRRVVKNNLKGCKGVKLMESVVFQDHDIYYF